MLIECGEISIRDIRFFGTRFLGSISSSPYFICLYNFILYISILIVLETNSTIDIFHLFVVNFQVYSAELVIVKRSFDCPKKTIAIYR